MKNLDAKNLIIIFLVLLNVATIAAFWLLRPPAPPRDPQQRRERTHDFLREEIGWDDTQFEIFKTSRDLLHKESGRAMQEAREDRRALVEALMQETPDTERAQDLAAMIGEKEAMIQQNLVAHYLELWEMSSPEQRERLQKVFRRTLVPPSPRPGGGKPPRKG